MPPSVLELQYSAVLSMVIWMIWMLSKAKFCSRPQFRWRAPSPFHAKCYLTANTLQVRFQDKQKDIKLHTADGNAGETHVTEKELLR